MGEQFIMLLGVFLICGLGNIWFFHHIGKKEYAAGYHRGYEDEYKKGRQDAVQLLRNSAVTESDLMDD